MKASPDCSLKLKLLLIKHGGCTGCAGRPKVKYCGRCFNTRLEPGVLEALTALDLGARFENAGAARVSGWGALARASQTRDRGPHQARSWIDGVGDRGPHQARSWIDGVGDRGPQQARSWIDGVGDRGPHQARFWIDGVGGQSGLALAAEPWMKAERQVFETVSDDDYSNPPAGSYFSHVLERKRTLESLYDELLRAPAGTPLEAEAMERLMKTALGS